VLVPRLLFDRNGAPDGESSNFGKFALKEIPMGDAPMGAPGCRKISATGWERPWTAVLATGRIRACFFHHVPLQGLPV